MLNSADIPAYDMTPFYEEGQFMNHQPIPGFASEEEEAAWWDAHPEVLTERFQTATRQGQVRRLSQTNLEQ